MIVPVPRIPARPARQHFHMNAYQISGELSYNSANDNTAAVPQSDLRQRRRQFPFLTTYLGSRPRSGLPTDRGAVLGHRARGFELIGEHEPLSIGSSFGILWSVEAWSDFRGEGS